MPQNIEKIIILPVTWFRSYEEKRKRVRTPLALGLSAPRVSLAERSRICRGDFRNALRVFYISRG